MRKSASTRNSGSWCRESKTNPNFNMWINHPGSVQIEFYSRDWFIQSIIFLVKNNKGRGRFLLCSPEEKAAYFGDAASSRIYDMPDWIYVNMASVSVHKYALATKTFTIFPPPPPPNTHPHRTLGNCLRLPLSFAIIMIIILSRGLIQLAGAK